MKYIKSAAYYLAVPALLTVNSITHDPFSEAFTKIYIWVILLLTGVIWLALGIAWVVSQNEDVKSPEKIGGDTPLLPLPLSLFYTLAVAAWVMTLGWNVTAFAYLLANLGMRAARFAWNDVIVTKDDA